MNAAENCGSVYLGKIQNKLPPNNISILKREIGKERKKKKQHIQSLHKMAMDMYKVTWSISWIRSNPASLF